MICSEARLAANRRNAQLSTGPRSAEGKATSRANALKHGLCATAVVPESIEAIQDRSVELYDALRPLDQYQARLVNHVAIWSLRIDRCERMERRVRDKVCLRAELTWDDDRRLEAEVLGGKLAIRPAEAVETLRRTPQGCEWLMARWAMLAHAAETDPGRAWTADQTRLAFDLLATPAEFRAGRRPGALIDLEGRLIDPADDPVAVARRQVAELVERRAVVEPLDEAERALAASDLANDNDPELRRLRRYEVHLHRQVRWATAEIRTDFPDRPLITGLRPGWVTQPEPVPRPEAKTADEAAVEAHPPDEWSPPFCLTPDEYPPPGQKADLAVVLDLRKKKRLLKAQARRESRRRKLDRIRA